MLKQCITMAQNQGLILSALLHDAEDERPIPHFNSDDIEWFGQRAAYVAQIRQPWVNDRRTVERQYIQKQVSEQQSYNEARGGFACVYDLHFELREHRNWTYIGTLPVFCAGLRQSAGLEIGSRNDSESGVVGARYLSWSTLIKIQSE